MRVIGNKIAVTLEAPPRPASVIISTSAATEQIQRGKVVAVGNQVDDVFPGNYVQFDKFQSTVVTVNGQVFSVIPEAVVLVVE